MDTSPDTIDRLHRTLKVAMKNDAMMMVMDTLVRLTEVFIAQGEKERAAELVTIALEYPMRAVTRQRAEQIYLDLEAELCPRVMTDAKSLAEEITLDDLLAVILGAE
jgi:ribosomal protein S20